MLVSSALWPLGRRRPRSGLINGGYDRPVAPVARGVVAAQFWRIEPGGYASIEEKRIVAAQAVAKETGKLIKVHPTLADDEVHLGRARQADAIPRLAIGGTDDESGVNRPVDDEHRP